MQRIGLKEALAALRQELGESILAAAHEWLRFEVGEITLQFQVEVERTTEGEGGIKFWVVELGGKRAATSTTTHTVTIPLKPVRKDKRPVLTGEDEIPE